MNRGPIATTLLTLTLLYSAEAKAMGSELYADYCSGCHGEFGEGNADLLAPVLAALDAHYINRQVSHFRSGMRQVEDTNDAAISMVDLLPDLTDADIDAIAAYLQGLPLPALEDETPPPGFRGRGLYSGCSSCHGAQAGGNDALNAPRLSGQYGWYLKEQLLAFRAGRRGFHAEDAPGGQMKKMADAIASEDDIDAIVGYITAMEP